MTSASSLADDTELLNINEGGTTSDEWVKDLSESSESTVNSNNNGSPSGKLDCKIHERWEGLLGVRNRPDPLLNWDQLYNLSNQSELRKETRALVDGLASSRHPAHDIESIITLYCKKRAVEYELGNGWLDIMRIMLGMNFDLANLYNCFYAITTKYIPRQDKHGRVYDLFRLVIQYHDPELCSHLDSLKIQPQKYAADWFKSLIASSLKMDVCRHVWDLYFKQCVREEALKAADGKAVAALFGSVSLKMEKGDIEDLFDVSTVTMRCTPDSLRSDFHCLLFGSNLVEDFTDLPLNRILCMPISVQEVFKRVIDLDLLGTAQVFNYFVIDSRSHEQFATGSILGAYNLNARHIVEDPESFRIAMTSLLQFKSNSYPKDHICFLGSGLDEDDAFMHMVIARFLQRNVKHISYVDGGYKAVHSMLKETNNLSRLNKHEESKCEECRRTDVKESAAWTLMERMKKAVKTQKEAISSTITNMTDSSSHHNLKHAKPGERTTAKRYGNMKNVFSINDEGSDSDNDENLTANVTVTPPAKERWTDILKRPNTYKTFEGYEVFNDKTHTKCYVLVSYTHLVVYHEDAKDKDMVVMRSRHPLQSIVRVTSKRRVPEFLTFKFGYENSSGQTQTTKVCCFILQKSGDCAQAVKQAILRLNNLNDAE